MKRKADFSVRDKNLPAGFGVLQNISDGGYERGYAQGYTDVQKAAVTAKNWTLVY